MNNSSVLFVNAHVYCPSIPFATAVLVQSGVITWVGDASGAHVHREIADKLIDCNGYFLAPAFVDAHVHATSTGLLLDGLDLSEVRNKVELLDLLSKFSRTRKGDTVIGHGWDETQWGHTDLPSRQEIDRATWGSVVYLSRIDVHSALVSSALVAQVPQSRNQPGYSTSAVSAHAHETLRSHALNFLSREHRIRAQEAFLTHVLRHGIASVHEMAGPTISSESDASSLIEVASVNTSPRVFVYWGQLAEHGGIEVAKRLGAVGVGGDLFVDGAIGSRTAALMSDYLDAPGESGRLYLDENQVASHTLACVREGLQTGFHVIGDRGMQTLLNGLKIAADSLGTAELSRGRHRLEHAEMIEDYQLPTIRELNLTASMQPLFDASWGGEDGMYNKRLGVRYSNLNRWATLLEQGLGVCFSSDAPVTEVNPWAAIHAAMYHHNPTQRITARAAFSAHTRGGWRALGHNFDHRGVIEVGAPADLALWLVEDYGVQVPDSRVVQWSTDARSATPPLPHLGDSNDFVEPQCLLTMVEGDIGYINPIFAGAQ